ncbi:hypothetical protein T440DRAFT_519685 [Plenodomus tracheiphilus IPT5]|uniref:Uncharacterized protein n=1 Tax=Plenodomus tracheiphilus IPT5 TaxID=1408161 RepID=A0A6A7B380_9PLEO|nr:hypothetical protein T440DRAFT_519685 [Plenodomus tracheiphilus IPT5]
MARVSKIRVAGKRKLWRPLRQRVVEKVAQNTRLTQFCQRIKSIIICMCPQYICTENYVEADTSSARDDSRDPKRRRIARALEDLWRRIMRKKKSSQDASVEPAFAHAPYLPSEAAMEKVMSQLNLLAHEIRDLRQAQEAGRALATGAATVKSAGPGPATHNPNPPEASASDSIGYPEPALSSSAGLNRMEERSSNTMTIRGPRAHFSQSLAGSGTPRTPESNPPSTSKPAESFSKTPSSPTVVKSTPWPEPLFNNTSRRELLHRIEKFRFTHLFEPQFIKQLSDPHARVDIICNNLLNIRCDMERLCSIWSEVTTGAPSAAVLKILEPWKRVGKEPVTTICDKLRRGIDLYFEWLPLATSVRQADETSMGQDWWAEYDKKMADIEEMKTEELLAQIHVVEHYYLGSKECRSLPSTAPAQVNAKEPLGLASLRGREHPTSAVHPGSNASQSPSSPRSAKTVSEEGRSSDLARRSLTPAVPRPLTEEQARATSATRVSSPSAQRERFPVRLRSSEETHDQPSQRTRYAVIDERPRPSTNSQLAPLPLRLQPATSVASQQEAYKHVEHTAINPPPAQKATNPTTYLSLPRQRSPREQPASSGPSLQNADGSTASSAASPTQAETNMAAMKQKLRLMWASKQSNPAIVTKPRPISIAHSPNPEQLVVASPQEELCSKTADAKADADKI